MITYEKDGNKSVEVLTENVCFRIDENFEARHALPLLSSLQSYMRDCKHKTESWNKIHHQNRRHILNLIIACTNISMRTFLINWLRKEKEYYHTMHSYDNLDAFNISNFDYYVDITWPKVLDIVKTGHLHFHQGVDTLIGCSGKSLPDLNVESDILGESGTILLADCSDMFLESEYESLLGDKFKTIISVTSLEENKIDNAVLDLVRMSEAVIGRRGFTTYAASTLGKPILELVNPKEDFWLLTQWDNKWYVPVILSPEFNMQRGVNRLWEVITAFRKSLISNEQEAQVVIQE